MESETTAAEQKKHKANLVVAGSCLAFFGAMIGMAYAAVPLYSMFCKVTGYGGTTQRVTQYSTKVLDRDIIIRFDANTMGVPWEFEPEQRSVTIKLGETTKVAYKATNKFSAPTTGRATFNVQPELAGAYFNKVECFCFTNQTLKAGETVDMPIVFYVDPDILKVPELKDIKTITLSYSMYQVETKQPLAATLNKDAAKTISNTEANLGG
ncbi:MULTISPECIES: cytochrome c oxidase assembly protein [Phyllobacteriaceae]|jgi:cytochrome c oxidase assembly protein subunit 11|uniref:Cytochrome c oxidase assembly protein CtaG n=1 Tax=Mesorhizobium hungaricum TaxID=1566387 RepID=A0A1C2DJC9_9HYPH|nr:MULTISPECIES: cytochrome c oxidase assembly protein [Mesorhizobium]MBN9233277.1 cytochrome c oxidase assembly protein [Mesorhizobium sp.]MDQ0332034.1 cytochrome c oxidase assembly protein subunit 11 [Mesorhizobium sp. YL-MeA3-2017]OCX14874.1 cytochrome c oxidase assembly protein [Mesorhizobium hungaricum]